MAQSTRLPLDAFQREAISFIEAAGGRAIYADAMGGRKTGTTATYLAGTDAVRALIVVPRAVHVDQWRRELNRYAPEWDAVRGLATKALRERTINVVAMGAQPGYPSAYITTYDSMRSDVDVLAAAAFDTVIFDEGHKLKGRTTQVAKASNVVAKNAERVLAVTGTPVLNHPEELWQYLHLLYPRQFTSFWSWAEKHFIVTMRQFGKYRPPTRIVGDYIPGQEDVVRAQLQGVLIQREIQELFPGEDWALEPLHFPYEVQLTTKERKFYDKLVKHSWGVLPGGHAVVAKNKAVVTARLQQVASDWGGLDEALEDSSKVTWAADDIAEWVRDGKPVVAFVKYRATARRLVRRLTVLGVRARAYTGDETPEQKQLVLDDYADGKVDVVVGTMGSLAEGVDGLQYRTNRVAMLDREWVPGLNDQAIGRVRRSGQVERVEVRHYYAAGTTDQAVLVACLRKTNVWNVIRGHAEVSVVYGLEFDPDDHTEIIVEDDE